MVELKNAEKLINILKEIKEVNEVDGLKIYFINENEFCVKGIKEEKIVCLARKRGNHSSWDLKK